MPTFRVEQYELHVAAYTVEAKDKAEVILRVMNGETAMDDDGLELIEIADDFYQPGLDLTEDEIEKLAEKDHPLNEDGGIPSIRSVNRA